MNSVCLSKFYHIHDTLIYIEDPNLFLSVLKSFSHLITRTSKKEVDIIHITGYNGAYKIAYNKVVKHTENPILYINYLLRYKATSKRFFCMHAAGVEKNGKAIVFPASSCSGKSTLVTCLVFNGFSYISDDEIIFDMETEQIVPSYKPIHLRKDVISIIKEQITDVDLSEYYDDYFERFIVHPKVCTTVPTTISQVIVPRYSHYNYQMQKILTREKYRMLFLSSTKQYTPTVEIISFFGKISRMDFFTLEYSDLHFAKNAISSLII